MSGLRALEGYVRRARTPAAGERCELCAGPVLEAHRHVADLEQRSVLCACRPCAILFERQGAGAGRYRTIPDRVLVDPDLTLTTALWTEIGVPVKLAFVFYNSAIERWVGLYPSPAGTTEAEIAEDGWAALSARTPLVAALEPDVEALLVYGRRGEARLACFLVPIDACYALTARIRQHWQGFEGGDAVRQEIEGFVAALRARGRNVEGGS